MLTRISCAVSLLTCIIFSFNAEAKNLAELKHKAEAGDAQAQYEYAEALGWNIGNLQMASPWWRKSAEQSYPYAIIAVAIDDLGKISRQNQDVEAKEKEYFEKNCPKIKNAIAAIETQQSAEAFYNLGDVYAEGICLKVDGKKAMDLFHKAAEMGFGPAQIRLADIYKAYDGESEGVKWLEKAARNDMIRAKIQLASLYFNGKG